METVFLGLFLQLGSFCHFSVKLISGSFVVLLRFAGQKVGEGNVCLWCNERGKSFHSTQAVQQHMVDKGHCKLLYEGEALFEYADFYDYRFALLSKTSPLGENLSA